MDSVWFWVVVALALLALSISIRRGAELFVLRVHNGKVRFVRGRIPGAVLNDIRDVIREAGLKRAELKAVVRSGVAEWRFRGEVPEAQQQQLRNILGNCPLAKIRAGSRPARRRPPSSA